MAVAAENTRFFGHTQKKQGLNARGLVELRAQCDGPMY